jgi:hypothetical protein
VAVSAWDNPDVTRFVPNSSRERAAVRVTAFRRRWAFWGASVLAIAAIALLSRDARSVRPDAARRDVEAGTVATLPGLAALGAPRVPTETTASTRVAESPRVETLDLLACGEDDPALPKERVALEVEVVDPLGRAVPGAIVQAAWAEWHTKSYVADSTGRLVMRVPEGTRGLEVVGVPADDDRRFLLVHYHSLTPGDATARVVIRLGSEITGVLVDDSGAPIPNARICAVPTAFGYPSVQTDEAGAFALGVLDGSEVDVAFDGVVERAPDVESRRRGAVRRVPSGARGVRVVAIPVEFESTLRARFLLDDGTPASRFEVVYTAGGGTHGHSAWTDDSGRVTITGQPDWPVRVGVLPPRTRIQEGVAEDDETALLAFLSRHGTRWEVDGLIPDGVERDVHLAPRTALRGVVRLRDGSPVTGAECTAWQGRDGLAAFSTDGDGRFLTVVPLRPGTVIQVSARGLDLDAEPTARGVRSDIVVGYEEPTIVLEEIGPLLAPSRRPVRRVPGAGSGVSTGSQ